MALGLAGNEQGTSASCYCCKSAGVCVRDGDGGGRRKGGVGRQMDKAERSLQELERGCATAERGHGGLEKWKCSQQVADLNIKHWVKRVRG